MSGWMRRTKRYAALVLTVVLAFALGAATHAQSRQDLSRLALENRLAELLVDLKLTPDQLAELRTVVVALKEAQEARASKAASLLEERKAAVLSGNEERVKKIDEELRGLRSTSLSEIPEAKSFLGGLTERQKQVLGSLLGVPVVTDRQGGSREVMKLPGHPAVFLKRIENRFDGRGFGFRVILPHAAERQAKAPFIQMLHRWAFRSGESRLDAILEIIDDMLR